MPRLPEFQNILDEAQDEIVSNAQPLSVNPDQDADPELLDESYQDDLGLSQRRTLDKEVDGIVADSMANDYTVRKESDKNAEKLYQQVKDKGYTRQQVVDNYKQVAREYDQGRVREVSRALAQVRDPQISERIKELVGDGTIKNPDEYKDAGSFALWLEALRLGWTDTRRNDELEDFLEANQNYDPLFDPPTEQLSRKAVANSIANHTKQTRAVEEAIGKHYAEADTIAQTFYKAFDAGDVTMEQVLEYLNGYLLTGKSLSDLTRSLIPSLPSLVASAGGGLVGGL